MSLIRIAARISSVEALKGKTLVGNNVLDSEIGALSIGADGATRTEKSRPFIAAYTDGSESKDVPLRSLHVNGVTDFVFETGVTTTMTEQDPETDETVIVGIGIPATDRGLEFFLDMVARQVSDALTTPDNEWGQVFLSLTTGFHAIRRARTSGDSSGVRLAGQQLTISASLLNDPITGVVLKDTHPLSKFFALAATLDDPVVATQIALMQAQIVGTVSDYKIMQQRFGRVAGVTGAEVVGAPIQVGVVE